MMTHKRRALWILLSALIVIKGSFFILLWPDRDAIFSWSRISAKAEAREEGAEREGQLDGPRGETLKKKTPTSREALALLKAIQEKETALAEKERAVKEEEQQLLLLKKDIEEKLVVLKQQTDRLQKLLTEKAGQDEDRILKLAKVFESTPPEQAGPLLGSLETKVAARILLKMNGKKAGKAWGYVNLEKAVKISQELASAYPKTPNRHDAVSIQK